MATRIGTFRMDLGVALDQPGTEPSSHSNSAARTHARTKTPETELWSLTHAVASALTSAETATSCEGWPSLYSGYSLYGDRRLLPKPQPLSIVLKGLTPRSIPLSLDGHFHQKWAPLHDPRDTRSGTKGFVKITLSVRARGDPPLPLPPPCPGTSSDIEK